MDDQHKTALVNSFTNIVRQSGVAGIDAQRLGMAFRMSLEGDQTVIELQPLFDYLTKDQGVPEQSVLELCVILKAREEKLSVTFAPAEKQAELPDAAVQKIMTAFHGRVGTWDKTGEVVLPPKPGAAAEPGWAPKKDNKRGDKRPRTNTRVLAAALGVCVLAGIFFFGWRAKTLKPPMREIPIPAGVKCAHVQSDGTTAICDVTRAMVKSMDRPTLEALALNNKRALRTRMIVVRTLEDQKIIILK